METMEIRKKRRICLVVAYDGTNYQGWQIQQNGNTIEAELNRALSALTKEPIEVSGASRTDSGVHARCNYAVFDTAVRMPGDKFSYALNQRLPEDIRVRKSYEVSPHWHPRKCSSKKTYEYRIFNDEFPDPLCRLYTHFTYTKLDIDRMNAAAGYLIGEHDFKSFCSIHTQTETTVRTITDLSVKKEGSLITIRTEGLSFVMTAMFVVIFLDQWGKDKQHASALIGLAASVLCLQLFGADGFLIPTMVCILVSLLLLRKPLEAREGGALQ